MLTRFFGESKPINFILVAIFMSIFYAMANFPIVLEEFSLGLMFEKIALLLLYVLSMVLLNFIAKKNELNKMNTYTIVIFGCFTVLFFNLLKNNNAISASIFVILALRRIVSLRTNKDISKKVFDAAFWLCIASLFEYWTILFIVVLYFGILAHTNRNWRLFLIPIIPFFVVFSIMTTFYLYKYGVAFHFSDWFQASEFDFSDANNLKVLIPVSFLITMIIWVSVSYLGAIGRATISQKSSMYLILISLIVSLFVAFFSSTKDGSELMFLLIPLAIMTAKYFEREKELWFKESILIILIVLPIVLPFLF